MNSLTRYVGCLIIVILAATQLSEVCAAVNVTFDDRVLYLNGYIDGIDGFNEYFDDAFASPTGDFVSPVFSQIINDGRSSLVSFVNSGTEINALIDLDSTDAAQFVGVGSSYGDVFVDPKDGNAGSDLARPNSISISSLRTRLTGSNLQAPLPAQGPDAAAPASTTGFRFRIRRCLR